VRNAWIPVLLLAACQGSPPAQPEAARRYAVRGEIVQVGVAGAGAQLLVRHEAIDDFVDASGKVVGMDAMVMPFDVAPPLSAAGLSAGDRVVIRFSMDWKGSRLRVEAIERLPADTVLRFGPARPPVGR
jgi:Cu/Ag efflux protein CusF